MHGATINMTTPMKINGKNRLKRQSQAGNQQVGMILVSFRKKPPLPRLKLLLMLKLQKIPRLRQNL